MASTEVTCPKCKTEFSTDHDSYPGCGWTEKSGWGGLNPDARHARRSVGYCPECQSNRLTRSKKESGTFECDRCKYRGDGLTANRIVQPLLHGTKENAKIWRSDHEY